MNSLNLKQLAEALENRKGSVVRARVRFFARTFVFVVSRWFVCYKELLVVEERIADQILAF